MNRTIFATAAAVAALAVAPAANAEGTHETTAETATPAAAAATAAPTAPAAPMAPATTAAASFSDVQISSYAKAVMEIQTIQADATLDETAKQTQMQSAVQAAGLDVPTFNAIATQSQADEALQARIQQHIALNAAA